MWIGEDQRTNIIKTRYSIQMGMNMCTQQSHTYDNLNQINLKEVRFSICFCLCFIIDLLMQHKICCVNLIGRSRGTYNMYQITSTYLKSFPCVWTSSLFACCSLGCVLMQPSSLTTSLFLTMYPFICT